MVSWLRRKRRMMPAPGSVTSEVAERIVRRQFGTRPSGSMRRPSVNGNRRSTESTARPAGSKDCDLGAVPVFGGGRLKRGRRLWRRRPSRGRSPLFALMDASLSRADHWGCQKGLGRAEGREWVKLVFRTREADRRHRARALEQATLESRRGGLRIFVTSAKAMAGPPQGGNRPIRLSGSLGTRHDGSPMNCTAHLRQG